MTVLSIFTISEWAVVVNTADNESKAALGPFTLQPVLAQAGQDLVQQFYHIIASHTSSVCATCRPQLSCSRLKIMHKGICALLSPSLEPS